MSSWEERETVMGGRSQRGLPGGGARSRALKPVEAQKLAERRADTFQEWGGGERRVDMGGARSVKLTTDGVNNIEERPSLPLWLPPCLAPPKSCSGWRGLGAPVLVGRETHACSQRQGCPSPSSRAWECPGQGLPRPGTRAVPSALGRPVPRRTY